MQTSELHQILSLLNIITDSVDLHRTQPCLCRLLLFLFVAIFNRGIILFDSNIWKTIMIIIIIIVTAASIGKYLISIFKWKKKEKQGERDVTCVAREFIMSMFILMSIYEYGYVEYRYVRYEYVIHEYVNCFVLWFNLYTACVKHSIINFMQWVLKNNAPLTQRH